MPIRMTDDPQDQQEQYNNDNSGGGGGGNFPTGPGGGGGGGLLSLLPLLLGLFGRGKGGGGGKGIIILLVIAAGAYFFLSRSGCNISDIANLATGGFLDPKQFEKAEIYEPLADDNTKNPLPESANLQKYCPTPQNQGSQGLSLIHI